MARRRCCSTSSLAVGAGEVVTLLGRNGMGKTTTVRAIMGLLPRRPAARSPFDGARARRPAALPDRAARHRAGAGGAAGVPDALGRGEPGRDRAGRGPRALDARRRLRAVSRACASAARHRGTQLSGGEQQMLAIGRALMTNPRC